MAICLNNNYIPKERYRAVVEHGNGKFVVSAGPGTGKTFSLIRKIESLIDGGVDPSQIYYLTFVNSIVDAFKEDISKPKKQYGLGINADGLGINILTLHSLAFKIIKTYSAELELPSYLEIIDLSPKPQSISSQVFVDDLFQYSKGLGITDNKRSFNQLLYQLTEAWKTNVEPINCEKLEQAITLFFKKYSVCSWDQLVLLAIKVLSKNRIPRWLQNAQHFMIDEYQDFNPSEQRLLELITEPADSVIIVGDPDQSIYSGRSASPQGLINLLARDDVEYVNFTYCRRCPKKVIAAANNMLQFMHPAGCMDKKLQLFKDEDGDFTITQYKSCKEEVEKIADVLKGIDALHRSDVIVLVPTRKVAEYYTTKLCEAGIVCNTKITNVASDLLSVIMRLIILHNHPFLQRVVLSHFLNVERKYRNDALFMFVNGSNTFIDTLNQVAADQNWQKKLKDSLLSFTNVVTELISDDVDSIITGFSGLNLEINPGAITNFLANDEELSERERVESFLNSDDPEEQKSTNDVVSIKVMTMHSSKGLSKQLIIIPAFDQKLLPGDSKGERLAEKHRLMYVALTRAERQVVITFPETRAKGDPLNYGAKPKISSYADILLLN